MHGFNTLVLDNGLLDDKRIVKKEMLYKGMNGRFVERFYVSSTESFIFKPLTHDDQSGKELWVHDHILSSLPPIYPRIVAKSPSESSVSWIIFEDFGPLNHVFNESIARGVTRHMASWHSLPTEPLVNASLAGHKPYIEQMAAELQVKKDDVLELMEHVELSDRLVDRLYALLDGASFTYSVVLSHGDLHQGNYAMTNDRIVVLDWEHLHLNSPYWDLYHVIDLRHPLYEKQVTPHLRKSILNCYLDERERMGLIINRQQFIRDYCFFSSIFSLWMLLLINKDLTGKADKWPEEKLRLQHMGTVDSLKQCLIHI